MRLTTESQKGNPMNTNSVAAEVFAPGEFIREEIKERGWTQAVLAEILGRPPQTVNQIIRGKKEITPETATALGEAFGTSAELWWNLECAYRLSRAKQPDANISRRAKVYDLVPVSELVKRGWIPKAISIDQLEKFVCEFLEMASISDAPKMPLAARRSGDQSELSPVQLAWAFRAKHVAKGLQSSPFDRGAFEDQVSTLPAMSVSMETMQQVGSTLADLGIRLVIVPKLSGSKIDGATFWLDDQSPVVALSLRFDRVDNVWFTLMHELAHVWKGDGKKVGCLDVNLVGRDSQPSDQKSPIERAADRRASAWLIPAGKIEGFIQATHPYYSDRAVCQFAEDLGIHPGVVVGRLQHLGKLPWTHLRRLLTSVGPMLGVHTTTTEIEGG